MNTNTTTKKRVAIVTGASSGMGLGITQGLLQHGYRVVANSLHISKSKDLKPSSDLILVEGDIGKMDTAIKGADAAIKHFDRIDLLANCAGIYIPKPFTDYTPEDFELMISTNVVGYFFITQRVVAQTEVRPYRGHLDGFGGSAVGRRAHYFACGYQVHNAGVSPRIGDGIRG
jgi:NAD(P)-dependent dehydrogenase (short-subunit alcohol dehydrogenase family)